MLQAFAFLCLPVKTEKNTPLNFCFYQKSRFNLVFTGPFLLCPLQRSRHRGVSCPRRGESAACRPASPPGPGLKSQWCHRCCAATTSLLLPLVSNRPQKPCGTTGTIERASAWSGAWEGLQASAHDPSFDYFHSLLLSLKIRKVPMYARTSGARGTKRIGMKALIMTNKKLLFSVLLYKEEVNRWECAPFGENEV